MIEVLPCLACDGHALCQSEAALDALIAQLWVCAGMLGNPDAYCEGLYLKAGDFEVDIEH